MFNLLFTESYDKKASRFLKQHPDIKSQYEKCLKLLEVNPNHPSLRLHQLKGKMNNLHSVSINLAYRIVIYVIFKEKTIIPIDIGTHDELYQ